MHKKPLTYRADAKWIIVAVISLWVLSASPLVSQSERRSLRVWVDTVDLSVCEDKEFETWGVWLESFTATDTVVGFRAQDTVLGCSLVLYWDTSKIRLRPPYVRTPVQTLLGRFPRPRHVVDTLAGVLWLDYTVNETMREVVGQNIPLFYLTGHVKAEDTVTPIDGGARVNSIELTGVLGENVGTLEFLPGYVRVTRDTTPEYTGTLRTTDGILDTNRRDTVFVVVGNLFDKRVHEFQFALRADTAKFRFVDTVTAGTLAANSWSSQEIYLSDDSIFVRLDNNTTITTQDSVVIGVVLERKTDSAFQTKLLIPEFGINFASCLGKLIASEATVEGAKIPVKDTVSAVVNRDSESNVSKEISIAVEHERIRLDVGARTIENVLMYGITGDVVAQWPEVQKNKQFYLPLPRLSGGVYFLLLQEETGNLVYKQLFIQTK